MEVSSQGAALLNGSDADGGSLNSGTGCINTRRERETEEEAEGGRASLERRVGAARMVVCWSGEGRAQRMESSAGRVGPAGAKSGVACWSWDW